MIAESAAAVGEVCLENGVAPAAHDDIVTVGAESILGFVPRNIADVHIVHSGFHGNIMSFFQGRNRSRGEIFQEVVRMKTGKMERNIGADFIHQPGAHYPRKKSSFVIPRGGAKVKFHKYAGAMLLF